LATAAIQAVVHHPDAGYEDAIRCAKERGLDVPGVTR
jgi:urocanate hydratase